MRLVNVCWSLPIVIAAIIANTSETFPSKTGLNAARHGVAYFEPPKSIGTPIGELARSYTGLGLADQIAGRLRLETDASLDQLTRDLIRRNLAAAAK
jgi:hypothetical protein